MALTELITQHGVRGEVGSYSKILQEILHRNEYFVVGKDVRRIDGLEKVLGRAKYTTDRVADFMVHVKVAGSIYPHAVIKSARKDRALEIEGVVAVVTPEDIPGENQIGSFLDDQPLLVEKARFIGDSVALVVGVDEYAVERGLAALEIQYEQLQPVFDVEEALKPGAPRIHKEGNMAAECNLMKGDVDSGFADADVVVEHTYYTQRQDHAYIEPEAAIAIPGENGITVIGTMQDPFYVRRVVARVLGCGRNQVRVVVPYVGGGFGGKATMGEIICAQVAVAAAVTNRPAVLQLSREESLRLHGKRVPFKVRYKTGASKDGKLTAVEADLTLNLGAYVTHSLGILKRATVHATGPYEVPAVKIDSKAVYTNTVYTSGFNGFGNPQVQFAAESQLDELAEKLGLDPVEFRLRNVLKAGSLTGTSQLLESSAGLGETLSKTAAAAKWEAKRREYERGGGETRRGIGVACSWHGMGTSARSQDCASAAAILNRDGTVTVRTGIVELGQGTHTAHQMIAAEILGIPVEKVHVESPDTSAVPEDEGTHAQRGTTFGGTAVADAAIKLRRKLTKLASQEFGCNEELVVIKDGKAFNKENPSMEVSFGALVARLYADGTEIPAEYGFFRAPRQRLDSGTGLGADYTAYTFGCCIAEVEVDTQTGVVTVLGLHPGVDAGKAINMQLIKAQLYGASVMGLGFALMEDVVVHDGSVLNPNLTDYVIPTIADKPEFPQVVVVEDQFPPSAFGVKGVGEIGMISTAPAITNAIYDAIGVRFRELPVTSEKVYFSLMGRGTKK